MKSHPHKIHPSPKKIHPTPKKIHPSPKKIHPNPPLRKEGTTPTPTLVKGGRRRRGDLYRRRRGDLYHRNPLSNGSSAKTSSGVLAKNKRAL
jgi:hypothetical protein